MFFGKNGSLHLQRTAILGTMSWRPRLGLQRRVDALSSIMAPCISFPVHGARWSRINENKKVDQPPKLSVAIMGRNLQRAGDRLAGSPGPRMQGDVILGQEIQNLPVAPIK